VEHRGGKAHGASMAVEVLIAGLGALLVLGLVFASWMAVVPLLIGGFGSLIALRLCIDPKRGWAVRVRTRFQRRQLDRVLRERTD